MILKPIENINLAKHLDSIHPDSTEIFLLGSGAVRGALIHGTSMVNQMRSNHGLGILETLILGHSYLGIALMTSMIKGRDRISFSIECGGPIKGLSVEASADGDIRGYLLNNPVPLDGPLEDFDLSPFFGPGFLKVIKYIENSDHPFTGQVMLQYGNIALDLANYFLESEQLKTAFALSVYFDKTGNAAGAGGMFLQAMPGSDNNILETIEAEVNRMPSIGKYFAENGNPADLVNETFREFSPEILETRKNRFFCGCSKERFTSFLASMNTEDKNDILTNGPFPLTTTCHNCSTDYEFSREELQGIFSN